MNELKKLRVEFKKQEQIINSMQINLKNYKMIKSELEEQNNKHCSYILKLEK